MKLDFNMVCYLVRAISDDVYLSTSQKLLALQILQICAVSKDNECTETVKKLMELAMIDDVQTFRACIQRLVQLGWITIESRKGMTYLIKMVKPKYLRKLYVVKKGETGWLYE